MINPSRAAGLALLATCLLMGSPRAFAQGEAGQDEPRRPGRMIKPLVTPTDETLTKIIRLRSKLRNLDLQWDPLTNGMVLTGFTAELGGGPIRAEGRVDWFHPMGDHRMKMELTNVDFRTALTALNIAMDGRIEGRITGTLDFIWRGLKLRDMKRSVSGTVDLALSNGSATRMEILDTLARQSGLDEFRNIQFTGGGMKATVKDGLVAVPELVIITAGARLTGIGSCQLDGEEWDARFQLSVTPDMARRSSLPAIQQYATRTPGKDGMIPLPVTPHFVGTLTYPRLVP